MPTRGPSITNPIKTRRRFTQSETMVLLPHRSLFQLLMDKAASKCGAL